MNEPALKGQPAIIYGRFSSTQQHNGLSLERQIDEAHAYIAEQQMELVPDGVWFDKGVSAFRGKHREQGQLGLLLDLVLANKLPPGVVIVIENIDRLSRETPLEAFELLTDIVKAGAKLVTLHDKQLYSRERLNRDPSAIILVIAHMQRAHSEAQARSERSKASWAKKRKLQNAGQVTKGRKPFWINSDGSLKPEQAELVKRIIDMYLSGHGLAAIARTLNAEGVPTASGAGAWHQGVIVRLLQNPQLIGLVGANKLYTPVIDQATFKRLQETRTGRFGGGHKSKSFSSVLRGIVTCKVCGSNVQIVSGRKGARSIYCRKARIGACTNTGGISYRLSTFFAVWSTWQHMATMEGHRTQYSKAESVQPQIDAINNHIAKLVKLVAKVPDIDELAKELTAQKTRLRELEADLAVERQQTDIDAFAAMMEWVSELPEQVMKIVVDEDIPASEQMNARFREAGLKLELERDPVSGKQRITDGKHWAYLTGRENLAIVDQGLMKRAEDGTMEIGAGYWFLGRYKKEA